MFNAAHLKKKNMPKKSECVFECWKNLLKEDAWFRKGHIHTCLTEAHTVQLMRCTSQNKTYFEVRFLYRIHDIN